ncbi:MAG: acido-empty-quinoprotein group A [Acidobacteriaceae bacterium]
MMFLHIWKRSSSAGKVGLLLLASVGCLFAQNSTLTDSIPPVSGSWPTFNGDYSGRRYSLLTQINRTNVKLLKLAWAFQTHAATLKSTPLEVDGILYFTVPNQVWAIDAKTGEKIWEFRRPAEGDDLGQRGVAFYKGRVYFGTTDAHFFCLDARNGKKIWEVTVADVKFGYYISVAPLIVKGLVILGTSGDSANVTHFVEALDWKTGKIVWRTSTVPKPGTPAARTWPNDAAMSHGGGPAWLTGTYDPDLNLIYWGTGNPHPVLAGTGRTGANLYTCSILALNADTGAIVWYFQASPHDTHDWDAVETPVLLNATFNGKPRKLLAQASRNGYFFVLDRKTGKNLLTTRFGSANWATGIDSKGSPIPNPAKEPLLDGALITLPEDGGTSWMSPSFDPETELFYLNAWRGYSFWYLSPGNRPTDHQGGGSDALVVHSVLLALDYRTGKIRWQRPSGEGLSAASILTTAGHVLFTADASGNLLALDPTDGRVLWHTRPGGIVDDAAPMTYQLDGTQYVVTGVDGVMYAWSLTGSL